MLRPQDNPARETKRLDGLWDFCRDAAGVGRTERWWLAPLPQPIQMPVPASFNDITLDPALHDHVGEVWYQRVVRVPRGWDGERVVVRFDSATHRATVWVDDHEIADHEGGYTPFEADLTGLVTPGAEHRLTVAVDNELTWQTIPPGSIQVRADGSRRQHYLHDFFNYAGLHRSVWLHSTPRTYIDDVTVVTDIDGSAGLVACTATTVGDASSELRFSLRDATGALVATATGPAVTLRVEDAELWRPGHGYLYDLTIELMGEDGSLIDQYELPVGIRTVRIAGAKFLINGEPFHFEGFGMHEDLAVRGKGHDTAAMIHDFELLDWIGANSFRTSHYPYAEEVLDQADRRGIVVIDETAAVGLNLAVGAGVFLGGNNPTFSDATINAATQQAHRRAIEELVARDKNHPSVVLWSLANEPESGTEAARDYFAPLFDAARAADPIRPVGFANIMLAPPDRCLVTDLADVVMINRYYGWYVSTGDLDEAEQGLEAELRAWAERHDKPIIVTEYGADAVGGLHSATAAVWSEEFQAELLDRYHRVFDRIEAVVGEQVWNFADFATAPSIIRVDGNKKGVFTRDRRPKAAAHLLRRRWKGEGDL